MTCCYTLYLKEQDFSDQIKLEWLVWGSFGKNHTEYTFIFEEQNRINCTFMKALMGEIGSRKVPHGARLKEGGWGEGSKAIWAKPV